MSKTMKTVTVDELAVLLAESSGATTISLIAETDARLNKTGNPFGKVYKVAQSTGILGADYENRVNNQLAREGSRKKFVAAERNWGDTDGRLVEKDGVLYLNFSPNRTDILGYKDAKGNDVSAEDIEPFQPKKSENTRQRTEKEIKVRNYMLSNIKQISFGGNVYKVKK